jgi:hypothetical protein
MTVQYNCTLALIQSIKLNLIGKTYDSNTIRESDRR